MTPDCYVINQAKCLALKLSSVIGEIINEDQVGYIKGRRVSTLLRLIDDVTEQLNAQKKSGCYLQLIILKPLIEFPKIICCVFLKN